MLSVLHPWGKLAPDSKTSIFKLQESLFLTYGFIIFAQKTIKKKAENVKLLKTKSGGKNNLVFWYLSYALVGWGKRLWSQKYSHAKRTSETLCASMEQLHTSKTAAMSTRLVIIFWHNGILYESELNYVFNQVAPNFFLRTAHSFLYTSYTSCLRHFRPQRLLLEKLIPE